MPMFVLYSYRQGPGGWVTLAHDVSKPGIQTTDAEEAIDFFKRAGVIAPVIGLHPQEEALRRQRLVMDMGWMR